MDRGSVGVDRVKSNFAKGAFIQDVCCFRAWGKVNQFLTKQSCMSTDKGEGYKIWSYSTDVICEWPPTPSSLVAKTGTVYRRFMAAGKRRRKKRQR